MADTGIASYVAAKRDARMAATAKKKSGIKGAAKKHIGGAAKPTKVT